MGRLDERFLLYKVWLYIIKFVNYVEVMFVVYIIIIIIK